MLRFASCLAAIGLCASGCLIGIDESLIDSLADGGSADGGTGCASGMVSIPGTTSCIDATEVTNEDYEAFVIARGGDLSLRPPSCSFDTQNEPSADWPPQPSKSDHPVVFVDWCDAVAYCAHQSRQLCTGDVWRRACGPATYPYGASYQGSVCQGDAANPSQEKTASVGGHPSCEGGAAGAFDLSGNVEEWVDECSADDCGFVGGNFLDPPAALTCQSRRTAPRATSSATRGFRCCTL